MSIDEMREIVQMVCESSARAWRRYHEVSGLDPEHFMPEPFIGAFVLNDLGSSMTICLEASAKNLGKWDHDAATASRLNEVMSEASKGYKVDMVVFEKGESGQVKDDLGMLALVEFKKMIDMTGGDRERLRRILANMQTCPFGVVCGAGTLTKLEEERDTKQAPGEEWCQSTTCADDEAGFFVGAWLFGKPV